jgi:hypothetical protein
MKYNGGQLWVRYAVVEVPESILDSSLMTFGKLIDCVRSLVDIPKQTLDSAVHYIIMHASDDEIQAVRTNEDVLRFVELHGTT